MAVLMATHDLELIRRHPTARVFEMDQGELVYDSETSTKPRRSSVLKSEPTKGD